MYKREEFMGHEAREVACQKPPFGPGFGLDVCGQTMRLEIWCTEFTRSGPDYCEFRAFDVIGNQIETRRVEGY